MWVGLELASKFLTLQRKVGVARQNQYDSEAWPPEISKPHNANSLVLIFPFDPVTGESIRAA